MSNPNQEHQETTKHYSKRGKIIIAIIKPLEGLSSKLAQVKLDLLMTCTHDHYT